MMKKLAIVTFAVAMMIPPSGCGGAASNNAEGSPAFVGRWRMLTENGKSPLEQGMSSVYLELTQTTLRSEITLMLLLSCTWTGDLTYTETTMDVMVTGGDSFCASAVGARRSAMWSVSGAQLTLDWEGVDGALQVYEKI